MSDVSDSLPRRLVFVSHSGDDTWVARQIAQAIGACGAESFLDEDQIDVGNDFEDDIRTALEKADELVVLLTPWALDRPYIWVEVGAAWLRQIPIVGLLFGVTAADLQARPNVPILLMRRDLLPLNDIDVYLGQLRRRVDAARAAAQANVAVREISS